MQPGYLPCLLLIERFADATAKTGQFYALDFCLPISGTVGMRTFTSYSIALEYAKGEAEARRLPLFEQGAGGNERLLFDPFDRSNPCSPSSKTEV
jgi:hypothetical protein